MYGPKGTEVIVRQRKLRGYESDGANPRPPPPPRRKNCQVKVDEIGRACITCRKDLECMKESSGKIMGKEITKETYA
jgi:hypothetical protein